MPTKVRLVKAVVFLRVMYGCESESLSVVSDSLQPHGLGILQARILEWIKIIPKKKKGKKAKWLSEEVLQIAVKKRSKKQRRKGKIHSFECKVPKNSKER